MTNETDMTMNNETDMAIETDKAEPKVRKIFTVAAFTRFTAGENKGQIDKCRIFTFRSERQANKTADMIGKLFATAEVELTEQVMTAKADDAVAEWITAVIG